MPDHMPKYVTLQRSMADKCGPEERVRDHREVAEAADRCLDTLPRPRQPDVPAQPVEKREGRIGEHTCG